MSRVKILSDAELVWSAADALNVAENVTATLKCRQTLEPVFVLPLLREATDAMRVASAALLELRSRAEGVKPPKVG